MMNFRLFAFLLDASSILQISHLFDTSDWLYNNTGLDSLCISHLLLFNVLYFYLLQISHLFDTSELFSIDWLLLIRFGPKGRVIMIVILLLSIPSIYIVTLLLLGLLLLVSTMFLFLYNLGILFFAFLQISHLFDTSDWLYKLSNNRWLYSLCSSTLLLFNVSYLLFYVIRYARLWVYEMILHSNITSLTSFFIMSSTFLGIIMNHGLITDGFFLFSSVSMDKGCIGFFLVSLFLVSPSTDYSRCAPYKDHIGNYLILSIVSNHSIRIWQVKISI